MKSNKQTCCTAPTSPVVHKCYICSRASKITALIGLTGIFMCGAMVGGFWTHKKVSVNTADSKVETASKVLAGAGVGAAKSQNKAIQAFVEKSEKKTEIPLCEERENELLGHIYSGEHADNVKVYVMLSKIGCPENSEKYLKLAANEDQMARAQSELAHALGHDNKNPQAGDAPCVVIEKNLLDEIDNDCYRREPRYKSGCYAHNAEIYAQIAHRGCKENYELYANHALQQIQIADGVRVVNYFDRNESYSLVRAYTMLKMKQEAINFLKKIKESFDDNTFMDLQRIVEE